jgi:hypothetical protein
MRIAISGLLIGISLLANTPNSLAQEASNTGAAVKIVNSEVQEVPVPPECRHRGCSRREDSYYRDHEEL